MLRSIGKLFVFLFSALFIVNSVPANSSASHSEVIESVYSDTVISENSTEGAYEELTKANTESDSFKNKEEPKTQESKTSDTNETKQPNTEKNVSATGKSTTSASTTKAAVSTVKTTSAAKTTTSAAQTTTKPAAKPAAKTSFSTSKSDVYINYSSDAEKWIAQNLVNGNTSFSVAGYPSLCNYKYLLDVIDKVIYQNPYILGVYSQFYDETSCIVTIHYSYESSNIKAKQNEIKSSANRIISSIISGGMSDEQKRLAIYNYLQSNVSYDQAAADSAKASGYRKTSDHTYENSFNAYGAIVKKKGVCMAYASAFKLLCDMAGVTCVYVTGTLKGASHMWNMVKIDGAWYHVDPTNNKSVCGVPYKIYNAPQSLASENGYALDKDFTIDSEFSSYKVGTSYSYEYYTKNKLIADSFSEYKTMLKNNLKAGNHCISIRFNATYDQNTFINTVKEAFKELGMGSNLSKAKGNQNGKYLVVTY